VLISSDAHHTAGPPCRRSRADRLREPARLCGIWENRPALPAAGMPLVLLTHEDGSYLLDWSAATYTIKAPGTSASGQSGWEEATGVIVTDGSDLTAGITVGASRSGASVVKNLQQVIGRTLDRLMPPLGRPVQTRNDAYAMQAAEVSVDERVLRLGVIGWPLGKPEVPSRVLLPGVGLQVSILICGRRLD
jgi:hypothetical protein